MVEISQHLVHLLLLVMLHHPSKLVHHVYLVLRLLAQGEGHQRPFLFLEMLGLVAPLLVHRDDAAAVDEVAEDVDEEV